MIYSWFIETLRIRSVTSGSKTVVLHCEDLVITELLWAVRFTPLLRRVCRSWQSDMRRSLYLRAYGHHRPTRRSYRGHLASHNLDQKCISVLRLPV